MKLNANELKLIALITMIVDHIGVYFAFLMPNEMYSALRIIGRIAMPIFSFFIVQGYIYTKNFKKYIFRISLLAVISQLLMYLVYVIYPREDMKILVNTFNIVFSFALILLVIRSIDKKIIKIEKFDARYEKILHILDCMFRLLIIILVIVVYFKIKIDYGVKLVPMAVCVYLFEKIIYRKKVKYSEKCNVNKDKKTQTLLKLLELATIYLFCIIEFSPYTVFTVFSLLPLYAYDGTIGKKTKFNKYIFYIIFAFQGVLLYILSCLFY